MNSKNKVEEKNIVPQNQTSKPVHKWIPDEVKQLLVKDIKIPGDLDENIKYFCEKILPKYTDGNQKEKDQAWDEFKKKAPAVLMAFEMESHYGLAASFNENYRGLAKELCNQLIEEFDCKKVSEKMLIEIMVNGYVRTIENSARLNNCMETGEYLTANRTGYLGMMSKQIDRSVRQYLSALATLKQLKTPPIEMNIKTNTAFIAQNQQINNNEPDLKPDEKINEAK